MIDYSYLSRQCIMLELPNTAFFDEKEEAIFNKIPKAETQKEKDELQKALTAQIASNNSVRSLNISMVVDKSMLGDEYRNEEHAVVRFPEALDWKQVKLNLIMSCFESELTRCLGYKTDEFVYDLIKIEWISLDMMIAVVSRGVDVCWDIDGKKVVKHYVFQTAGAGDMRKQKYVMIAEDAQKRIWNQLFAGLTKDIINEHGGCNVSKFLAYCSLTSSATNRWTNPDGTKFSIRNIVVVKDYHTILDNIEIDYITKDYIRRDIAKDIFPEDGGIDKNAADGSGICLPNVLPNGTKNSIIRGPFLKGLLATFDFRKFCNSRTDANIIVKDFWGKEHDIIAEDIKVIMTDSMFKMASMFDNWEEYCQAWERNDCWLCTMKPEATDIEDCETQGNYQFFQSNLCLNDEDLTHLLAAPVAKVKAINTDSDVMLKLCGENLYSKDAAQRCLALYNPLIKHEYFRQTLKESKKAMVRHLKSSDFKMDSKRVFCLPDLYAFCEYLFCGITNPKGLIPAGQCVFADRAGKKVAALRSPGLFIDGVVLSCMTNNKEDYKDDEINPYEWMDSNAIYISSHDGSSFNLNLDFDGDELCVVEDDKFIAALERTLKKFKIVTHYYPGIKAPKQMINDDAFVWALRTASRFNIGTISNSLTKLWNNPVLVEAINNDDWEIIERFMKAGKYLLLKNQGEIDGAKTGKSLELSKEAQQIVESCIGSKGSKKKENKIPLPYFFQFTDNFKKQKLDMNAEEIKQKREGFGKINSSVCNTICSKVSSDFAKKNDYDFTDFGSYDYRMLLAEDIEPDNVLINKVIGIFKKHAGANINTRKKNVEEMYGDDFNCTSIRYSIICRRIVDELNKENLNENDVYEALVIYLFKNHIDKASYVKLFFMIFGKKAEQILKYNVENNAYEPHPLDKFQHYCKKCGKIISSTREYCEECKEEIEAEKTRERVLGIRKTQSKEQTAEKSDKILEEMEKKTQKCTTVGDCLVVLFKLKDSKTTVYTPDKIMKFVNNKFGTNFNKDKIRNLYNKNYKNNKPLNV